MIVIGVAAGREKGFGAGVRRPKITGRVFLSVERIAR